MSRELPVSPGPASGEARQAGRDQPAVLDYPSSARRVLRESPRMRESVIDGTLRLDGHRRAAYAELDIERWRRWAARVKDHLLSDLGPYLARAESRLSAAGAQVHWARTAADVHELLDRLVSEHDVGTVVKGKSMLSEEVEVNRHLEASGVEVVETDLGEYVVQMGGEEPSHILAPAVHRSLGDIRALFARALGTDEAAGPEELAAAARSTLRSRFLSADMGVTGGNFLVAETGTLALIENEGNIRFATSLPRIHVAVVGIEKLLPRASDLAAFLQLASRGATGQRIGTFVSLIHGPAGEEEPDGPEELHVVLVDSGRSSLLADDEAWETLRCIRCSACLNVCPVYRQTGGHAYDWMYSGPIGAVLAPGLLGLARAHSLPEASTLCGACFDACPVRIPIPELLLSWRRRAVEAGLAGSHRGGDGEGSRFAAAADRMLHRIYARLMTTPWLYRAASALLRRLPRKLLRSGRIPLIGAWSAYRAGLEPSPRSFRELWSAELADGPPRDPGRSPRESDDSRPESGPSHGESGVQARTDRPAASSEDPPTPSSEDPPTPSSEDPPTPTRDDAHRGSRNAPPLTGPAARVRILESVREASGRRRSVPHPGDPGTLESPDPVGDGGAAADPVELFTRRFTRAGGEVHRLASAEATTTWLYELADGFASAAVSPRLPRGLHPPLPEADPRDAELGVSLAACAAAATGSLILSTGEPRALQLLPPAHLVWIPRHRIVGSLQEALARAGLGAPREGGRAGAETETLPGGGTPSVLAVHSGPSKSADLGGRLVRGVHGPGRVIAAILPRLP